MSLGRASNLYLPTCTYEPRNGGTMDELTPAAIVAELDSYIVGQRAAKRAVAVALRSRVRRTSLPDDLRDEVSRRTS